jgi:osmoprotectant transport system substrate-binding protein
MGMKRATALSVLTLGPLAVACSHAGASIAIGSKNFTESLVLGELYAQALEHRGIAVTRKLDLGGTDIAMAALRRGEIDLYPEYTGTALLVVLKASSRGSAEADYAFVKDAYAREFDLTWLAPAPMNDTQALATTQAIGDRFALHTLSDVAARAPQLRLGAVPEFLKRPDGLPGLRARYGGFAFKDIRLLDFGVKYDALVSGAVDVVVAFGTDGAILARNLRVMIDDRHVFPTYQVAPVVRTEVLARAPHLQSTLDTLAPLLTDSVMRDLNDQVDGARKREPADVAHDFLAAHPLS